MTTTTIGDYINRLKIIAKLHMQLCAVQSQQNQHKEAAGCAKLGAKFSHILLRELQKLCKQYVDKIERNKARSAYEEISVTSPVSLIDICALKILPVLNELLRRVVPAGGKEGSRGSSTSDYKSDIDMRCMFGYLNMSDWTNSLNIGAMMQISPLSLQDILPGVPKDAALSRESVLEKIALLCTSYFCIATEKRFVGQESPQPKDKIAQYKFATPNKERYIFLNKNI